MVNPTVAKKDDGEVQITFVIPFAEIKKAQDDTLIEMAKDVTVPGYRKGKAPLEKSKEKISKGQLIEHSLSHLLPEALGRVIKDNNLKLAIYPKYELTKSEEGKDWEVVARTCELPEVALGEYKKTVAGEIRSKSIKKELTKDEKEQVAIRALLDNVKLNIPKILIDEEVNSRLTSLLTRIERLGLALESYLASLGKTPETLRDEYQAQAKDAIALDLILSKIAEEEKFEASEKDVNEALKTAHDSNIESDKRIVEAVIKKRKAIEFLISL